MKYSEILAKSNPQKTLLEHTDDCLKWFPYVIEWNHYLLAKMVKHYSLSESLLLKRLFITVAFHDIGKSTEKFQDKIRDFHPKPIESHSLSSVVFVYNIVKDYPIRMLGDTPYFPEILSIATHHSKLRKNLFERLNHLQSEYADESFYLDFFALVNNQARKLEIKEWCNLKFDKQALELSPLIVFQDEVLLNLEKDDFYYECSNIIRDLFLLFKSILHQCDWMASSGKETFTYSTKITIDMIKDRMKNKVQHFTNWSRFQLNSIICSNDNILVQIPTGQGKTEAAILWAVENNRNQKIIFLLPTMVTTNKMWERVCSFLGGSDQVALSHSTAQYILKEKDEDIEPNVLRQHYLYNRTFFKPVTVATVDQLIYSFFNWGHWVLTGSASYNAKIIIDEIHVYDAYTFGLLLEVVNCIKPFNSKFAIMSASLPNILKDELEKVLPDYKLIHDSAFDNTQRHIIDVRDCLIEASIEDMIDDYKLGQKVLIVCNTIKKAREVYDGIDEIELDKKMLYHSQFILKDKTLKEQFLENIRDIKGGFIAICTQIVEVSLDIDFDVLYTENAPIDAIIQRLGRVNRKGKIQERIPNMQYAKVVVTKESDISRKYVYKDLSNVLSETYRQLSKVAKLQRGCLTEADFKQIVDIVYIKENLGSSYYDLLNEGRNLIKQLWHKFLLNIYTLNLDEAKLHEILSRKTSYITVEAVLLRHYQDLNFDDVIEQNNFELLRKYTLKVPMNFVTKYALRKINDSDIYILDMKYNANEGLSLKSDDQNFI